MTMIQVESLTKRYGATTAVEDLSFSIGKGEIVGFLGPNGAGKSTTMRILAGSLGATEGVARIAGIDVFDKPREVKAKVGYLPEVPPLYTDMTVRSYLRFCAKIKGAEDPRGATEWAVSQVGLSDVAHRLIAHLSKGYRQRVGIAQALVHRPEVLILDEPASGLDPGQRVEIRDLVRELAGGDTTVILSTHVLPEVEAICKRVIIINKGKIVAEDDVANLAGAGRSIALRVARPSEALQTALSNLEGVTGVRLEEPDLYNVDASEDVREQAARIAVEHGLLELRSQRALEDIFLKLTAKEGKA